MDYKIRDMFAIINGVTYINNADGRAQILKAYGEDFLNFVNGRWQNGACDLHAVLSELKSEKNGELAAAFTVRTRGAFTTAQGYLMQLDTSDSLKMQGAIQLLEATGQTEGYLTQANDATVYHVPLATMKAVLVEMLAAYAACHARKQELRALINAAETVKDLDEIIISWPV